MPKKTGKRLSFLIKQFSNDDLGNSNKSENLSLHDKNDILMEEDVDSQIFILDDITEDDLILVNYVARKEFSIMLQRF